MSVIGGDPNLGRVYLAQFSKELKTNPEKKTLFENAEKTEREILFPSTWANTKDFIYDKEKHHYVKSFYNIEPTFEEIVENKKDLFIHAINEFVKTLFKDIKIQKEVETFLNNKVVNGTDFEKKWGDLKSKIKNGSFLTSEEKEQKTKYKSGPEFKKAEQEKKLGELKKELESVTQDYMKACEFYLKNKDCKKSISNLSDFLLITEVKEKQKPFRKAFKEFKEKYDKNELGLELSTKVSNEKVINFFNELSLELYRQVLDKQVINVFSKTDEIEYFQKNWKGLSENKEKVERVAKQLKAFSPAETPKIPVVNIDIPQGQGAELPLLDTRKLKNLLSSDSEPRGIHIEEPEPLVPPDTQKPKNTTEPKEKQKVFEAKQVKTWKTRFFAFFKSIGQFFKRFVFRG